MEDSRGVDADEEESDGSSEVDDDDAEDGATVDAHPLVHVQTAEISGRSVGLLQLCQIQT